MILRSLECPPKIYCQAGAETFSMLFLWPYLITPVNTVKIKFFFKFLIWVIKQILKKFPKNFGKTILKVVRNFLEMVRTRKNFCKNVQKNMRKF